MRGFLAATALMVLLSSTQSEADPLDPLYERIASDLKAGRPLVVTVHVALCDNSVVWCGRGGLGNGDDPRRNLFWGGAAGFRAIFDRARGFRRVFLDKGDGKTILERAVYRMRVRRPSGRLRRLGVKKGFELMLVGLAYRGKRIAIASDTFIKQVTGSTGSTLRLKDGRTLHFGASGHVVGYAGHNHLMDEIDYRFPAHKRTQQLGYFALSCLNAPYLAEKLCSSRTSALLLTLSLMYPGAFTINGLVRGIASGATQQQVYLKGVKQYARFQKRPEKVIRRAFTHGGQKRFLRRFKRCSAAAPSGRAAATPRPTTAKQASN
jgi:hypothetical protein